MDRHTTTFGELSASIVRAMAYYDLFNYPLTPEEIFSNLPTNHVTLKDVVLELEKMEGRSLIFRLGSFYSLRNDPALEKKRSEGNLMARQFMTIAARRANLIGKFPFIRSVMISGSLSKGYADAGSDIDFFVVTEPGRLWIARMLLVVYKRLFLFNSHKFFCVNYFVDSEHLEIEEKNLFTATELATLIPLYGHHLHHELIHQNSWVKKFFPNFQIVAPVAKPKESFLKKIFEATLNLTFPTFTDRVFMRATLSRWKRMYKLSFSQDDFDLAFKTNRHVSKNHPRNYQKRILLQYEERIEQLFNAFTAKSV